MKESISIENAGLYNRLNKAFKEQVDGRGRPIHPDEKIDSFTDFLLEMILELLQLLKDRDRERGEEE